MIEQILRRNEIRERRANSRKQIAQKLGNRIDIFPGRAEFPRRPTRLGLPNPRPRSLRLQSQGLPDFPLSIVQAGQRDRIVPSKVCLSALPTTRAGL